NETDHSESSNVLDHEAITRLLYILEILFLGSIDDDHSLPEPQDQPRAKRNDFVRVKLDLDRPERTAADAHPPSERDEKDFSAIVDQRRGHGLDSRPGETQPRIRRRADLELSPHEVVIVERP